MANWHGSLKQLKNYIYKISTPYGFGTGFQIYYVKSKQIFVVSTAYHVISHAYEWEQPIRLTHSNNKENILLKTEKRLIFPYPDQDLAFILFINKNLNQNLEQSNLEIIQEGKHLIQGVEIGWCGYPNIAPEELCFFSGHISASLNSRMTYLIDGVAINGVSGGPAFIEDDKLPAPVIAGVVTAYIPNRQTGETLPGLCEVIHLEPYQKMLRTIRSWDDAQKKADERADILKSTLGSVSPRL